MEFLFLDLMVHYLHADSRNQYIFSTDLHYHRARRTVSLWSFVTAPMLLTKWKRQEQIFTEEVWLMSVSQSFVSCGLPLM